MKRSQPQFAKKKFVLAQVEVTYYVADDVPTTTIRDHAATFPDRPAAAREAALVNEAWEPRTKFTVKEIK